MANTLEELQSGILKGATTLKLVCGLETFPKEILTLSDTLEVLDLSNNLLSELPTEISQLKKLRILFISFNKFTEFPTVLKECLSLNMIGFKSNKISNIPENAFPPKLNWLILTDNKIETLPKSIEGCTRLQKCLLSGNLIKELPSEMRNCVNLELLRISANKLKTIPDWLFELPKLSWIAFGGNPISHKNKMKANIETFDWSDFTINKLIGEGASGFISKAKWSSKNSDVAIKVFKGAVTSDGLPEDEMEVSILAGGHPNLIPVLGKINNHPENKSGLIMSLISPEFVNLGNPPSLLTCTRDTYNSDVVFTENDLLKIAKSMASVCGQLHENGINHGDFYAHNILVNRIGETLLGDFGAASFYDVNSFLAHNIERVEVRAFGCLIEDILNLVPDNFEYRDKWETLISDCTNSVVKLRPNFTEILKLLKEFSN